jgi:hypothetical protein
VLFLLFTITTNGYGSLAPSNPHITILVTLDAGRLTTERATTDSFPASMNPATRQRIDTSQCASFHGRFPPACLSSTFRVARWSVPSSATFGSSSSTAQLRPGLAQLRPSSAHRRTRPRLTSAYLRPSLFASTWHKLASAYHGTARLAPGFFASPRPSLASVRLASPRLLNGSRSPGLPRRFFFTGHAPIPSDKAVVQLHGS